MRAILLAAVVAVTAAMGLTDGEGEPVEAGGLVIEGPFARSVGPTAPSAAGYFTVTNTTDIDDRLLAASSDAAQRVALHTHQLEDGIARMVEVTEGVPIPAGATVALEQGGLHVMFMGLQDPWGAEGGVVVTLTFERAGEIPVTFDLDRVGHRHDPHAHGAPGEEDAHHGDDGHHGQGDDHDHGHQRGH